MTNPTLTLLENATLNMPIDSRLSYFLTELIPALIDSKLVTITSIAQSFNAISLTSSSLDSTEQRIHRFLKNDKICPKVFGPFVRDVLGISVNNPFALAIDRTEWQVGNHWHNILVAAVSLEKEAIPIFWVDLGRRGVCSDLEKMNLILEVLQIIPASAIKCITADREFASMSLIEFMGRHGLPFVFRLKKSFKITTPFINEWGNKKERCGSIEKHPNVLRLKKGECWKPKHRVNLWGYRVYFYVEYLGDDEYLILCGDQQPKKLVKRYKERWRIETCFQIIKTRGFNLENSHVKDDRRMEVLVGLITMSMVWGYMVGLEVDKVKGVEIKKHGRRQHSVTRVGMDELIKWYRVAPLFRLFQTFFSLCVGY